MTHQIIIGKLFVVLLQHQLQLSVVLLDNFLRVGVHLHLSYFMANVIVITLSLTHTTPNPSCHTHTYIHTYIHTYTQREVASREVVSRDRSFRERSERGRETARERCCFQRQVISREEERQRGGRFETGRDKDRGFVEFFQRYQSQCLSY